MKLSSLFSLGAALAIVALPLSSCAPEASSNESLVKMRNLTQAEAAEDFDVLVAKVRGLYGPLEYKQRRFGFDFNDLADSARHEIAEATTDAQFFAVYKKFLTRLQDGHVGITFPSSHASVVVKHQIPIFVTPVEHRAIVSTVGKELDGMGIDVGDEILSVDDTAPAAFVTSARMYSSFGNELSDEHLMYTMFSRPFYMTDLLPKTTTARVSIAKADGTKRTVELNWRVEQDVAASTRFVNSEIVRGYYANVANEINSASMNIKQMGAVQPHFMTPAVAKKFGFTKVTANAESLARFELKADQYDDNFAALYKYNGKTLLLIRMPHYVPKDPALTIKSYQAVLSQYEPFVDALIIDQNHNPGGRLDYVIAFYSLFAKADASNFVQRMHADRAWISGFRDWAIEVDPTLKSEMSLSLLHNARRIEAAYDAGQSLTEPLPFIGGNVLSPNKTYSWKKPLLVLADELAGSCGDIFPMLVKRNNTAKIFGKRTMGLGGNVEEVVELPHSQASVRLTRGLFTTFKTDGNYTDPDFVENNGILPDFAYENTVNDVRAGYVNYVEEFSKRALEAQ